MFRTSADGLIAAGVNPNRVITAIYPEAPACPTEEYRKATTRIAAQRERRVSTDMVAALACHLTMRELIKMFNGT
jgi:hypothetical protein